MSVIFKCEMNHVLMKIPAMSNELLKNISSSKDNIDRIRTIELCIDKNTSVNSATLSKHLKYSAVHKIRIQDVSTKPGRGDALNHRCSSVA